MAMTLNATFSEMGGYAQTFINLRSVKLVGILGLSRSDIEDIRQDLRIHLLERLPNYDPNKSTKKGFIAMVLNNRIRTIIRLHRTSAEAMDCGTVSLDEQFSDADSQPIRLFETVDEEEVLMNFGIIRRRNIEHAEMRIDVERFLSRLPDRLRELCLMLQEKSVSQIARETGTSRQKIHAELVRMRVLAEQSGLREYI